MTTKTIAAVAIIAIATLAAAQQVRIELRTDLAGRGKGKVTWKTRDSRTQRQAELEAEGERLSPNTSYLMTIGSNPPFPVRTNGLGIYRLSIRYSTAIRPNIGAGTPVTVTDSNAVTVQSGAFRPR